MKQTTGSLRECNPDPRPIRQTTIIADLGASSKPAEIAAGEDSPMKQIQCSREQYPATITQPSRYSLYSQLNTQDDISCFAGIDDCLLREAYHFSDMYSQSRRLFARSLA
jgi:hypothetical protein